MWRDTAGRAGYVVAVTSAPEGARIARKSDGAVVSARVDYGFRLSRSGEPPTYRYYRAISGCE